MENIQRSNAKKALSYFVDLLKQKDIKVRLHEAGYSSAMFDVPRVYAVNKLMSFTIDEIKPFEEYLCLSDENKLKLEKTGYLKDLPTVSFNLWIDFTYMPDTFITGNEDIESDDDFGLKY